MYKKLKQYLKRYPLIIKGYRFLFFSKSRSLKVNYPFGLENLELTNKCPMKCKMCVRTYRMTRSQGFMDMRVFTKIIDEISMLDAPFIHGEGFWLHHFGESLLHPEFDKMLSYCYKKGVKAGLSVNPMVMDKKVARRLIDARPNLLFLALDGHDDESFHQIRGVSHAYHKSTENILNFLEIKKEVGSKIKTVITMIDFPKNRESIDRVYDYWRKMEGIDQVVLKPFTEWNGEVEEINRLVSESRENGVIDLVEKKRSGRVKCYTPWLRMSISWDGNVVPCCFDYNNIYILGNVKESSLHEIWNGVKMQQLRKEFLSGNVNNLLCKKCPSLYK
jgi:radical SAM protein with 4Fe4S-binding SPASM domain